MGCDAWVVYNREKSNSEGDELGFNLSMQFSQELRNSNIVHPEEWNDQPVSEVIVQIERLLKSDAFKQFEEKIDTEYRDRFIYRVKDVLTSLSGKLTGGLADHAAEWMCQGASEGAYLVNDDIPELRWKCNTTDEKVDNVPRRTMGLPFHEPLNYKSVKVWDDLRKLSELINSIYGEANHADSLSTMYARLLTELREYDPTYIFRCCC